MLFNDRMKAALVNAIDCLNTMGGEATTKATVVDTFARTHHTLQQSFMRVVIIPILTQLADDYNNGRCDGRNMASGRLAQRMLAALTDDDLYIPFV